MSEVLIKDVNSHAPVEICPVGTMTADAALSTFRPHPDKAVITGGDRNDILLAAPETSTVVLILSANLRQAH